MLLILYWAYKSWTAWFSILITVGIIVICWLVASSVALRFFILFLGVMSCFYTIVCLSPSQSSLLFFVFSFVVLSLSIRHSWQVVGYHRCESLRTVTLYEWLRDWWQDTLQRKVNTSDASEYADVVGCCGSRFWGAFWLLVSCICESSKFLHFPVAKRDIDDSLRGRYPSGDCGF